MTMSEGLEPLLADDEPAPFRILNPDAARPILLVCDHASHRIPAALGSLGLDPFARRCHLAVDIGAGAVTEQLAGSLGATAVLNNYSRLVVDCNRELLDSGAFLPYGDGMIVPGNTNLRRGEKQRRSDAIYWPYHRAIDAEIQRLQNMGFAPMFASIHSFTPVLNGESRPWQMGVLWDKDEASARLLINGLEEAGFLVGDNEPYSGKAPQDFTIDHHAEGGGLPHVALEIRQDLITHEDGQQRIAQLLHTIIGNMPQKLGLKIQAGTA
ncbi:MAG: N-formylglutamate amidohydrolase [Pseudomonadota bacterium]